MAGIGSPKGKRQGGRPIGSRSKKTLERLEEERIEKQVQAELARRLKDADRAVAALAAAKAKGRKLPKEVLGELMDLFYGLTAQYQPIQAGQPVPPGRTPHPAKFEKFAKLTIEIASKLAPYHHPTFRAIEVRVPSEAPPAPKTIEGNVVEINDPVALARVYQRRMTAVGPR